MRQMNRLTPLFEHCRMRRCALSTVAGRRNLEWKVMATTTMPHTNIVLTQKGKSPQLACRQAAGQPAHNTQAFYFFSKLVEAGKSDPTATVAPDLVSVTNIVGSESVTYRHLLAI